MKVKYLVNMNPEHSPPSYDAIEFSDLKDATTTLLDIVDTLTSQGFLPDPSDLDRAIDVDNGKVTWTSTNRINVCMFGEHETHVVYVQPIMIPEFI